MLKDQLFKTSGLKFDNWLFGPEKFSELSKNFRETSLWTCQIKLLWSAVTVPRSCRRHLRLMNLLRMLRPRSGRRELNRKWACLPKCCPGDHFYQCVYSFFRYQFSEQKKGLNANYNIVSKVTQFQISSF